RTVMAFCWFVFLWQIFGFLESCATLHAFVRVSRGLGRDGHPCRALLYINAVIKVTQNIKRGLS
ncbi:hypothetical protein COCVIDRAFT_87450, partial [Bipolaris victoriae FI3]